MNWVFAGEYKFPGTQVGDRKGKSFNLSHFVFSSYDVRFVKGTNEEL